MRWTDIPRLLPVVFSVVLTACAWLPAEEGQTLVSDTSQQKSEDQAHNARLESMFRQSLAALEGGDTGRARGLLERIHEERPDATGVLLNLGILAEREEDRVEAREWFERVLTVEPGHTRALNRLALLDREEGAFELARSRYQKALQRNPDDAPVLLNLAILLDIYLGRPGEALDYYQRYGEASPNPDPRLEDWIFDARQRAEN